jgi:hypothetical protein
MADGDHVALADEYMGLAEGNAAVHHLGCACDDKQSVAVLFELRSLVGFERVLDGEIMQAKFPLELSQDIQAGLVQADPDNVFRFARPLANIRDGHFGHPSAACINSRSNHARGVRGLSQDWPESVHHDQFNAK